MIFSLFRHNILAYIFAYLLIFSFCQKGFCEEHTSSTVFMVWPDDFAFNEETAKTNLFQKELNKAEKQKIYAMEQFINYMTLLQETGIDVICMHNKSKIKTPDAVFPNNWFSTHKTNDNQNVLVIYPMLTPNRRAERQVEALQKELNNHGININYVIDLTHYENENKALEGTGSLVLDRVNKIAFASLSPRTNKDVLNDFCDKFGYRPVVFQSYDSKDKLIFHTNVIMSVGERFAIICEDTIKDLSERNKVLNELQELGKEIINISLDQVENMCGNILQLKTKNDDSVIVMSKRAYDHFSNEQKNILQKYGKLLQVDIHTVEDIGGGSARCMLAEIF